MLTLNDLQSAHTYEQLAKVLGVPKDDLLPGLYEQGSGYKTWIISKKSGGSRVISSPKKLRRKIQGQIKDLLNTVYKAPKSVHGFVKKRSVVSNAACHVGQRTIINLDLSTCFDAVTFYRVRGLFLQRPFSFPRTTATILAHACTCQGRLPAGGITSPIILNLILSRLDKKLSALAEGVGGRYTRYADDLTFSFRRSPHQLSEFLQLDASGIYEIAPKLASEISASGFSSNTNKFRVSTGASRKVVTGLTVNARVNLSRKWFRLLESQIYAIEKFGLAKFAQDEFGDFEDSEYRGLAALRRVHGKLAYAAMVRGKFDWITAQLAFRFNNLHLIPLLKIPDVEHIERLDRLELGVWVIAAGNIGDDLDHPPEGNGTGFTSEGGYIVTARHAIADDAGDIYPRITVRNEQFETNLLECDVIAGSMPEDLAILKLRVANHSLTRVRFELGCEPKTNFQTTSIGYPDYFPGHKLSKHPHQVINVAVVSAVRKIRVTGDVFGGMSGGPLLDREYQVVGVTHRGIANGGHANEFISVNQLKRLFSTIIP